MAVRRRHVRFVMLYKVSSRPSVYLLLYGANVGSEAFKPEKLKIIGISGDPVKKQKQWAEKQCLNFVVLSDSAGDARKAYEVGKGLLGLVDARVTFVIDGKGVVRDVLDSTLNFAAHFQFVQASLEQFSKTSI
jgi:peroxiredoxin Q/BCP